MIRYILNCLVMVVVLVFNVLDAVNDRLRRLLDHSCISQISVFV